jgi:hypothetical protein
LLFSPTRNIAFFIFEFWRKFTFENRRSDWFPVSATYILLNPWLGTANLKMTEAVG